MKLHKLIILILSLSGLAAQAQFIPDYKKAADVYFQKQEYYAAAEFYKKALNISSDSANVTTPYNFDISNKSGNKKSDNQQQMIFNLAESYRYYKDFLNAEKWYAVAKNFSDEKYILSHFWYAEALRANNKYAEAIPAFEKFLEVYTKDDDGYKTKAKQEIESCKFAIDEMKNPRLATLKRLSSPINLSGSNYAPFKKDDLFYFTSSRPVSTSGKKQTLSTGSTVVKKKESPYLNAIYTVEGNNLIEPSGDKKPDRLEFDIPDAEYAAIALTPDGNRAFFTAWNKNEENKTYSIYTSVKIDDKWSKPESAGMQINVKGYNTMQPFVTSDGKFLLFSSDRPGGTGKYDIWFAPLRANGILGQAINLGNKINTPEDEQTPYYNIKRQKLLFASNGKVGLGGFDFYESDGNLSEWSEPKNLGFPFNSAKDDLYFTATDKDGDEGYISSDRESVCCLELFYVKREYIDIQGLLTDCETGKPVDNATVTLTDSLSKETKVLKPGTDGIYSFKLDVPRPVKITIEKEGYFTKTQRYSAGDLAKADTLLNPQLCLTPLVVDKPIVLKDIYYEFNSAELTPMSELALDLLVNIMVDNPNITIELSSHTDGIGSDAYNLDLSQRRAQSCVDYLINKGIDPVKISAKGYGKSMPIAPNTINGKDNPEGRQLNRRTEFKVLKK